MEVEPAVEGATTGGFFPLSCVWLVVATYRGYYFMILITVMVDPYLSMHFYFILKTMGKEKSFE